MTRRQSPVFGAALAVGVALSAHPQGGQVVTDQRPPVTFRAETNFVEIDAIVTDRDGRFVPGLTKEDFQVIEEGKPQTIAAFDLVRIPVDPTPPPLSPIISPEPDTVTNREPFTGRLFLLLLDDLQTDVSRTQIVRKAARDFIERHQGANDLVAVAFTSGRSAGQDFTGQRSRLVAAVDRFTGVKLPSATKSKAEDLVLELMKPVEVQQPPQDRFEAERALRAKSSLNSLRTLSEYLAGIRGRRKVLVYLGEGVDYDFVDPIEPNVMTIARDVGGITSALRDAASAATRGNVNIYSLDPRGLSTGVEQALDLPTASPQPKIAVGAGTVSRDAVSSTALVAEQTRSHQVLRTLADQTGGVAFLNTNDTNGALDRIVVESSSYYILGYYAPPGRRDGRFRTVDVKVTKPGLRVRARKGYFAPGAATAAAPVPPAGKASPQLQEAARSPLPIDGLAFSAAAAPFQGTSPRGSVVLVVEIDPARLAFTPQAGVQNTRLELQVTATDPTARPATTTTHHLAELRLTPQTYETVRAEGVRIVRRLDLAPGRYRLQLAVRDETSGAIGTLFDDVEVPNLFEPPLALSGLLVVSAAATRMPTVEPDAALGALLPGPHTARRVFPDNDTLAVYAEIYDNDLTTPHMVRVATTVRTAEGREVFSARAEHASGELKGEGIRSGGFAHRVTVPASELGVGRFVLRVEAVRSTDQLKVVRDVPFEIR